MVENYPTALRSLVLAENSISPELQQQICDLLSEGEEEEEVAGGTGDTQEWEKGREPAAARHQGSSSWRCPSGKQPEGLAKAQAWEEGWQWGNEASAHPLAVPTSGVLLRLCPPTDPSSQMVLMTSGLGDSLLAETEM